jgi:hypothetical protein
VLLIQQLYTYSPLLNVPMIKSLQGFEPCKRFMKRIPGHYFGTGKFGTGYYVDIKGESQPAMSSLSQRKLKEDERRLNARHLRGTSLWDFLDSLHVEDYRRQQHQVKAEKQKKLIALAKEKIEEKNKVLAQFANDDDDDARNARIKIGGEFVNNKDFLSSRQMSIVNEEEDAVENSRSKYQVTNDIDSSGGGGGGGGGSNKTTFDVPIVINDEKEDNFSNKFNYEQHNQVSLSHLLLKSIFSRSESPLYPFDYHEYSRDEEEDNNDDDDDDEGVISSRQTCGRHHRKVVDKNELKLICYHESLRKILSRDSNIKYEHLKKFDELFKTFTLANKHMELRENIDHISLEKRNLNYSHSTDINASFSVRNASSQLKRTPSLQERRGGEYDEEEEEEEEEEGTGTKPKTRNAFSKQFDMNNHDSLTMLGSGVSGWHSLIHQSTPEYKLIYQDHHITRQRKIITFHRSIRWRSLSEVADVLNSDPEMLNETDEVRLLSFISGGGDTKGSFFFSLFLFVCLFVVVVVVVGHHSHHT